MRYPKRCMPLRVSARSARAHLPVIALRTFDELGFSILVRHGLFRSSPSLCECNFAAVRFIRPGRWLADMWDTLSAQEKTALRKLAVGYVHDVPVTTRRRFAALGLLDEGSGRLTEAGLALDRDHPNRRKPGAKGLVAARRAERARGISRRRRDSPAHPQ
jgi:hypothetical protein